jgi:hypothetical protein
MRSIKDLHKLDKRSIFKSFNSNNGNVIITPRQWGLTTLLINYINTLPQDLKVGFFVNGNSERFIKTRINNINCRVFNYFSTKLVGITFDIIICDNFFKDDKWINHLIDLTPTLRGGGMSKIVIGHTGGCNIHDISQTFRHYNKIIIPNSREHG